MGWTPADVRASSLWQIAAAAKGFAKANGAEEKPEAPTEDEFEAALARVAQVQGAVHG